MVEELEINLGGDPDTEGRTHSNISIISGGLKPNILFGKAWIMASK